MSRNRIESSDIKRILADIARIMQEKKDVLTRLDGEVGDGDLGLTMERAFVTARDEAAASAETDPGKLFFRVGMEIARAAPSTMGTLVATGFMSGGKAVTGGASLDPMQTASFFDEFVKGIMQRGKCGPGEKTVVDVLHPAAQAFREATAAGQSLAHAFRCMLTAARQGLEASKGMVAQHGRVAYYQEQSAGKDDPGAMAGSFIVEGFCLRFADDS